MITCQELADLLVDFFADDATPQCRKVVQEHLAHCQGCGVFVQTYSVTIRLTRRMPAVPMRPQFAARLLQLLREAVQEQP